MIGRSLLVVGVVLLGLALAAGTVGGDLAAGMGPDVDDVVARSADGDADVAFEAEEGDYTVYAIVPVKQRARLGADGQREEAVRALDCTVERPGEADPLGIDGGPLLFDHLGDSTSVGWFSTAAGEVVVSCDPSTPLLVRPGRVGGAARLVRDLIAPALSLVGLVLVGLALRPWVLAIWRGRPPPAAAEI